MNKEEFLEKMQEILEAEETLKMDMLLSDFDAWDSVAKMATISLIDYKCGVKIKYTDLNDVKTIADIATIANI